MSHEDCDCFVRHYGFFCPELLHHANPVLKVHDVGIPEHDQEELYSFECRFTHERSNGRSLLDIFSGSGGVFIYADRNPHGFLDVSRFYERRGIHVAKAEFFHGVRVVCPQNSKRSYGDR